MENLIRKMTLILVAPILFMISGCTGSNSTTSATDAPPKGEKGLFMKGAWMDRGFVQKLKDRDFNSVWSSMSNFTGFATFYNEAGKPFWIATIPDMNGILDYREGKWWLGGMPIVEFFVEGDDTLARYFATAAEFKEKGGLDHPQIYQKIPCGTNPDNLHADDWFISEDCAFSVYYFAGKYDVDDIKGNHWAVELLENGTIKGNALWYKYGINTVNTLPVFYLGKEGAYERFVIKGNDSGFSLAKMMNEGLLEGDGNEIVQGPHVYEFVRR